MHEKKSRHKKHFEREPILWILLEDRLLVVDEGDYFICPYSICSLSVLSPFHSLHQQKFNF